MTDTTSSANTGFLDPVPGTTEAQHCEMLEMEKPQGEDLGPPNPPPPVPPVISGQQGGQEDEGEETRNDQDEESLCQDLAHAHRISGKIKPTAHKAVFLLLIDVFAVAELINIVCQSSVLEWRMAVAETDICVFLINNYSDE